ncbi:MAG TPA: hypothetical protein VGK02_09770 [Candidatus Aquicultor sp.]|jgi:hypothetical protein
MFSEPFFLLSQEGYITRSCICTGLTEIRKANLDDKGRFYTGFFQLAIGIERLAKLALILDYMVDNKLTSPGEKYVRHFGHDVEGLFFKLKETAEQKGSTTLSGFGLEPIPSEILSFISEFARKTRYANLDGLAKGVTEKEPVAEWHNILMKVLKQNVAAEKIAKILAQGAAVANAISPFTIIHAFDLQNNALTVEEWLTVPQLLDNASRYVVYEVTKILRLMIDFTNELAWSAREIDVKNSKHTCHIPELREFFYFLPDDRSYILRKKRWP